MPNAPDPTNEAVNKPLLRELIARHFSLTEISLLCFELNLDYEDLSGDNKAGKTMALVLHFSRRKQLDNLIAACQQQRPQIDWRQVYQPAETAVSPPPSADRQRETAVQALTQFNHLLEESFAIYLTQNRQRNRLSALLHQNHDLPAYQGYNDLFYQMHDQMSREERRLFQIIRGTTERSIFASNEKLRDWAEAHPIYQLLPQETAVTKQLEEDLLQLKIHFSSWFAKYHNVFLPDPKESLVYLDDEFREGTGFPKRLQRSVTQTLDELANLSR